VSDIATAGSRERSLSLVRLLDPVVLADPYPLYRRLREEDPVHWDPYLSAWVVTRYADVRHVLQRFSADRTPTPEQLSAMGLAELGPVARLMVQQMLFLDPPAHGRVRSLAARAFTPRRVEQLRAHIHGIAERLIDAVAPKRELDVIADFAKPLPGIVAAELMGIPTEDHEQLQAWTTDFAEILGNFQHNPDHVPRVRAAVDGLTTYFQDAVHRHRRHANRGLVGAMLDADIGGDRLSEDEVVANCIITLVGGQETTTNLIGNGLVALILHPDELARLRVDRSLTPSAVEELLRFEAPSQHTARIAPEDVELGGHTIRKGQAVIAVMAAGNRDPERFVDPDRLDLGRQDNRHLAFGWAAHFCFGAPLARIEGQVAFETLLRRMPALALADDPLEWRTNLGLRGLTALPVTF
jgi:pimeloyl-[acyl-carrier protein] synthase